MFRDCWFKKEGGHPSAMDITNELDDQVMDVINKGIVTLCSPGGGSPPKKTENQWRQPGLTTGPHRGHKGRGAINQPVVLWESRGRGIQVHEGRKASSKGAGTARLCHCQKLAHQGQDMGNTMSTKVAEGGLEPTRDAGKTTPFKLRGELLYGGQGKDNSLVTPDCIDNTLFGCKVRRDQGGAINMEDLCPPRLELTGDSIWGGMKKVLCNETGGTSVCSK
jgi:hypothetical protein